MSNLLKYDEDDDGDDGDDAYDDADDDDDDLQMNTRLYTS